MSVVSFHILYLLSFTRVPCTCAMTRYRKTLVPTKILSVTWNKRIQPSRTCKELTFQIGIISELTFMTRWLPCILPFHGFATHVHSTQHLFAWICLPNLRKWREIPSFSAVYFSFTIIAYLSYSKTMKSVVGIQFLHLEREMWSDLWNAPMLIGLYLSFQSNSSFHQVIHAASGFPMKFTLHVPVWIMLEMIFSRLQSKFSIRPGSIG